MSPVEGGDAPGQGSRITKVLEGALGLAFFGALAWGGCAVINFFIAPEVVDEPREIDPDQITAAGTELRVGEEAFVPVQATLYGDDLDGIVAITVTSVEPGDQDLFQQNVENSEGFESVYIRATVENVSREDLGDMPFGSFDLVRDDDVDAFLTEGGFSDRGIGDCQWASFPSGAEIGTIIETCVVDIVRAGHEAVGARWYGDHPIVWRR